MSSTPVLSARPSWTNRELAERMEVDERTVRRDVARLRDLGYGVESDPGPWGGYRMAAGSAVPPLNLDDDEALAVVVALRETSLRGVLGSDQAALSAPFKLQRILPRRVAEHPGHRPLQLLLLAPDRRGSGCPPGRRRPPRHPDTGRAP
ncbi:HTH domain-containing protein, partial [Streptomyces sp. NPDC049915]|uniref:helix-turn-helix transcriptional regulator n=1 Tax=Streptomyces sp. NPDC049915 TaxID=3155510 RepID=UPI003414865F